MSVSGKSGTISIIAGVIVILFAIAISEVLEEEPEPVPKPMTQVQTFGPVWNQGNRWVCTSDNDFLLHAAFRGINNAQLRIQITQSGSQSFYNLENTQIEPFTIGADGGQTITLTRTGTISGFLTLQTIDGADANCRVR